MVGILEYSKAAGITDIITVIDPVMDRVLKRSDNAPHGYVGKTVPMGKVSALAALLDCTDDRIQRVRNFAGIEGDVILDEDAAVQKLQELAGTPTETVLSDPEELQSYCEEQIAGATSTKEREAALALHKALKEQFSPVA